MRPEYPPIGCARFQGSGKEENAQLQQAVGSHAVIDQAIGVLIAVHQPPPADGWDVLREVSQHCNIKIHGIAGDDIAWALGQPLPQQIREELDSTVSRWVNTVSVGKSQE